MGMKTKVVAPIALSVGLLGIVGGVVAAESLSHPAPKPAVQLVQNAAQTVTVTPSPTTTTATPTKTATAAPKPAKPAPVQSTQAVAPAPRIVQKAAVVSSDTSTSSTPAPAPAPSQTTGVSTQAQPGQTVPPVIPANPGPVPSNQTHE